MDKTIKKEESAAQALKFPPWMKKKVIYNHQASEVKQILEGLQLTTVCQGAVCPNICECFGRGTAAFMILGKNCSRSCRFCAVGSCGVEDPRRDRPLRTPDMGEPINIAWAVKRLNLRYAVVTSVTRDDLSDGGASHFVATIIAIRSRSDAKIEILTPDFKGSQASLDAIIAARPDVFNHNIETIPRLYPEVRPQADYKRSLDVLRYVKENSDISTKSGIMVGMGEKTQEVLDVMTDLREAGCSMLTIGQYLAPSEKHYKMEKFVTPEEFAEYEQYGKKMGFRSVAAGAFVRSSYHAGENFESIDNKE